MLYWVLVVVHSLSLVVASRGYSLAAEVCGFLIAVGLHVSGHRL